MNRHPHHFKIAFALAISAGAWGIYWLPQRILEDGGLTGGWGTIAQMIIGVLILSPIFFIFLLIYSVLILFLQTFYYTDKKNALLQLLCLPK